MQNLNINQENIEMLEQIKLNQAESKKMTGLASIDKPWQKYYTEEAVNGKLPKMLISEYMLERNRFYPNAVAINYFGRKITHNELERKIIEATKAFSKLGIKKGDIVTLCMPTLPESIYSVYALNRLGAIANLIDPRDSVEGIKNALNETKTKHLVIIDICHPKIDKIIDETEVEKIISVAVSDSLPFGLNYGYQAKQLISYMKRKATPIPNDTRYIKWNQFIKNGKNYSDVELCSYEENMPAVMIRTSGTTGKPKGVLISNDALNALAYQYANSGIPHKVEDRFLNIMPLFLLYGLACGIHMPLCLGMIDIVIPQVDFKKFANLVVKHRPQHFMGIPTMYESLFDSPLMKDHDLSYLISPGVGGDAIALETEIKTNDFLESHNCPTKIAKGYGMTEGGAAVVVSVKNECNVVGGSGIPLCKNIVSIFDYELDDDGKVISSDKELTYGEDGEICVTGPTLMLGYYNNQEETDKVLKRHSDGKVWLHTNDIGYMDSDGQVYVKGRIKNMIIRPDGHNVFPGSIEQVIMKHPMIEACSVVGIDAVGFKQGKLPKAVVVLKDGASKEEVIQELIDLCSNYLPERDVAYFYEVVSELPVSKAGKIDKKVLETKTLGQIFDANIQVSSLVKQKVK